MSFIHKLVIASLVFGGLITASIAANLNPMGVDTGSLTWIDLPTLPGTKYAMLSGDPTKKGFFVARLKFPANYTVEPHYHNITEYDTVISGTFYIGTGKKIETDKGIALTAGSFVTVPAKTTHYGWTKEETVLQISGIGPWGATYLKPVPKS